MTKVQHVDKIYEMRRSVAFLSKSRNTVND